MAPVVTGGRTFYGTVLGVIMLDTVFPRLPGDVGNASTWPFPVRYKVVEGAKPVRVMGDRPDPDLLQPFVQAARQLEMEGVEIITTSCGFLSQFQRELADSVAVPVVASSLLQVPFVYSMLGSNRKVGILTERSKHLTEDHFEGAGWSSRHIPIVVKGLPEDAVFPRVFIGNMRECDPDILEREVVQAASDLVNDSPEVGAIVLECTNMAPFAREIRKATRRPVFDITTAVNMVVAALYPRDWRGAPPPFWLP